MRRFAVLTMAMAFASACAAAAGAAETMRIPVTMTEFAYSEPLIEVPAGRRITFEVHNAGKVDHDLVIEELGARVLLRAGQRGESTVGPVAAGVYVVHCSIPTHSDLGMVATLVVR